jgi:hypothetical protein
MTAATIESDFKRKVSERVRLVPEGLDRYRVFTPFLLEDGDHLAMVLKKEDSSWVLSDEGHTYMHLTYDLDEKDLREGTRGRIIENALSAFRVEDLDGELRLPIPDDAFGNALYSFVQAILKISDVSFLTRERVKSAFAEDFKAFILQIVPQEGLEFDWADPEHDAEKNYVVDCRITRGTAAPLFLFALRTDEKVRDATITLHQFERWGIKGRTIGIFEDQEEIGRKVLARFTDVCDKQYSSLQSSRDRIQQYFKELE